MKEETRIALLSCTKVKSYILFLLTVFRSNLIDGVCLDLARDINDIYEFIKKCKYLGEIRLLVNLVINGMESLTSKELDKIMTQYLIMTDTGELLYLKNVKSYIMKKLYTKMKIQDKIRLHKNILNETLAVLEGVNDDARGL